MGYLFYMHKSQVPCYTVSSFASIPHDIVVPYRQPSPHSQIICISTDCTLYREGFPVCQEAARRKYYPSSSTKWTVLIWPSWMSWLEWIPTDLLDNLNEQRDVNSRPQASCLSTLCCWGLGLTRWFLKVKNEDKRTMAQKKVSRSSIGL